MILWINYGKLGLEKNRLRDDTNGLKSFISRQLRKTDSKEREE